MVVILLFERTEASVLLLPRLERQWPARPCPSRMSVAKALHSTADDIASAGPAEQRLQIAIAEETAPLLLQKTKTRTTTRRSQWLAQGPGVQGMSCGGTGGAAARGSGPEVRRRSVHSYAYAFSSEGQEEGQRQEEEQRQEEGQRQTKETHLH